MPAAILTLLHEITFAPGASFVAAAVIDRDEWVLLANTGSVFRYKAGEPTGTSLMNVARSEIQYTDGGFDIGDPVSIYVLDGIAVVVNDYKKHGYVYRPSKRGPHIHLHREDYHADISRFPVALFHDAQQVPHLIHGTAWNRVDILNLETLQNLTAAKSLIEEDAELRAARYPNDNNIPWPRPLDYFYGALLLSPDRMHFLSKGWHWGSSDACYVFDIADFISNPRLRPVRVGGWEHSNRGICWMDDQTIAALYSPWQEGHEGSTPQTPLEIHILRFDGAAWQDSEVIILNGHDSLDSELLYDRERDLFAAFTLRQSGFSVIEPDGALLFHDPSLVVHGYHAEKMLFTSLQDQTITAYAIERQ